MSESLLNKKDDILYFKDENVFIKDNCLSVPVVKVLFNRDKRMGKTFFNKCITACYYMHHKDSPYLLQPTNIKKRNIMILKEGLLSSFDFKHKYYVAFEKWFIENHLSAIEIRYRKLLKDIDDLIERMTDIPLYKKISLDVKVKTTECIDGETIECYKTVKVDETIDNYKEKKDAISNIKYLDDLKEMLEKKLQTEYNKKGIVKRRLFDR